jgi:hypothetical protein
MSLPSAPVRRIPRGRAICDPRVSVPRSDGARAGSWRKRKEDWCRPIGFALTRGLGDRPNLDGGGARGARGRLASEHDWRELVAVTLGRQKVERIAVGVAGGGARERLF